MRDSIRRPSPLRGASPLMNDLSSTSALLQEISTLRNRLKDLEDDTKSSVVSSVVVDKDSPLVQMLRRDVAALEEEKATLEKDLMNQMSQLNIEHQKKINDLTQKLRDAQKIPSHSETYKAIEELKASHQREVSRLQENLVSAETEISDSRAELDTLNEELLDLQTQRHTLLDEVTTIRVDLAEERRVSKTLKKDLNDTKLQLDALESEAKEKERRYNQKLDELRTQQARNARENPQLLSDKKSSESEIHDLRQQNQRLLDEIATLRSQSTRSVLDSPRTPVSGLVASFEQRARKFSADQGDMDENMRDHLNIEQERIIELQKTLRHERENVTNLREQLRMEKKNVEKMQKKLSQSGGLLTSSFDQSEKFLNAQREIINLQEKLDESQRAQTRLDAMMIKERAELNRLRSDAVYTDVEKNELEKKRLELQNEIRELRTELDAGKKNNEELVSLRNQLEKKEKAMDQLRDKHSTYKEESEETMKRLKSQVEALQGELESAMTKVEDLEGELERSIQNEQKRYEQQVQTMELELTMANAEHSAKNQVLNDKIKSLEEKSREASFVDEEKENLIRDLNNCKIKMAELEMSYSLKVRDLEGKIRSLEVELEEERKENCNHAEKSRRDLDSEVTRLTVELTKMQMKQADDERSHFTKVNNLEKSLDSLRTEAQQEISAKQAVIDDLSSKLLRKEEQIDRLEQEKSQLRSTMQEISFSRKDEMEEMESELLDLTSQTKSQAREIQLLKNKLEDLQAQKDELTNKQKRKIEVLEEEIHQLKSKFNKENRESLVKLKAENQQLRDSMRNTKLDKTVLKDKLENYTKEMSNSRSSQLLRERNTALKAEVEKLTKRLKKMEDSITRFAI